MSQGSGVRVHNFDQPNWVRVRVRVIVMVMVMAGDSVRVRD